MYIILIILHLIVSIVLIAVILLQAGKGGGLSETFGGGTTRTIFGTKASTFLTRATSVCAVVFLLTCLLLAIISGHRGRSLMEQAIRHSIPRRVSPIPTKEAPPSMEPGKTEEKKSTTPEPLSQDSSLDKTKEASTQE